MLFLFSLCSAVFATSVAMFTYKILIINILYIYTFNYLYLKLSSLPYFAAALYSFLSPVRFAFKLFTSSLPHSIADETSFSLPQILFPFSVFQPFLSVLSVLYGSLFVFFLVLLTFLYLVVFSLKTLIIRFLYICLFI